jgi:hypothetical protein
MEVRLRASRRTVMEVRSMAASRWRAGRGPRAAAGLVDSHGLGESDGGGGGNGGTRGGCATPPSALTSFARRAGPPGAPPPPAPGLELVRVAAAWYRPGGPAP